VDRNIKTQRFPDVLIQAAFHHPRGAAAMAAASASGATTRHSSVVDPHANVFNHAIDSANHETGDMHAIFRGKGLPRVTVQARVSVDDGILTGFLQ